MKKDLESIKSKTVTGKDGAPNESEENQNSAQVDQSDLTTQCSNGQVISGLPKPSSKY